MSNKSRMPGPRQAVVLLSGGLDSAVTLHLAVAQGYKCSCLIFDYGQRHRREIESARRVARSAHCRTQVIKIKLPWKGSSLLDKTIKIPGVTSHRSQVTGPIPNTYVPGRNIIFLSFALSYAEAAGAEAIFIGAHCQDYSGYPDCRPEFYAALRRVIARGTKSGVENKAIAIKTPLIRKNKSQIIKLGSRLGVKFELTWSCYQGGKAPCGRCDSCLFREKGFREAGFKDPLTDKATEKR
jgi:7-cyano-7-deazaguanine synthase